jgi:hypothetical protein
MKNQRSDSMTITSASEPLRVPLLSAGRWPILAAVVWACILNPKSPCIAGHQFPGALEPDKLRALKKLAPDVSAFWYLIITEIGAAIRYEIVRHVCHCCAAEHWSLLEMGH